MPKALMISGRPAGISYGNLDESNLFGTNTVTATEADTQASCTEGATFSNLRVRVQSGGSGTNNFRFRDAGADGNQLATGTGAGVYADTTNSDVLTAGDLFNIGYTDTGTNSVVTWLTGNVTFASGYGCFHGVASFSGIVHDAASSTRYLSFAGTLPLDGHANEADAQWKVRGYTSLEAIQVRIVSNARTNTSTIKSRKNGADGNLAITITSGATGLLTDLTPADTYSSGDLACGSITLGTGVEDLVIAFHVGTFKSTNVAQDTWAQAAAGGLARAASATEDFVYPGGSWGSLSGISEANARVRPGYAGTASRLRIYLSANTYTANGTLAVYLNGVSAATVTITASGGAGWYEDTSGTFAFDADDDLSLGIVGGTSGSITIHAVGLTLEPVRLTAAQGTYTLTGQAATLKRGVNLGAAQGSYTLTGQAATLVKGRVLTAAQGSYALSGQAATLVKSGGQALTADQGTYTLTGQAATLIKAGTLTAAQGTYALTGQATTLVKGRVLTADQGSYALSGQAATLVKGRVLTAAQGAYALTGQAAALVKARTLTASQGTYTFIGQDATLIKSGAQTIAADQGSYILTGQDVTFTVVTTVEEAEPRRRGGGAGVWIGEGELRQLALAIKEDEELLVILSAVMPIIEGARP